jgi:hypothetical protein
VVCVVRSPQLSVMSAGGHGAWACCPRAIRVFQPSGSTVRDAFEQLPI